MGPLLPVHQPAVHHGSGLEPAVSNPAGTTDWRQIHRTTACRIFTVLAVLLVLLAAAGASARQTSFGPRQFGAAGDGVTNDTAAIQRTIDSAASTGAAVRVPPGRYLCGTLHLRTHTRLVLEDGCVLIASRRRSDFDANERLSYSPYADAETTYFQYALISGNGVSDVSVSGPGLLDGNRTKRGGPKMFALKNCTHINLAQFHIRRAPNYAVSLIGCSHAAISSVDITESLADGIDIDGSSQVTVTGCRICSADDAVCLKSSLALGQPLATEHVVVTDCFLESMNNDFKIGTETSGSFSDIRVQHCEMVGGGSDAANAGIAVETVDGADIRGVRATDIGMTSVHCPVFIRRGDRGRGQQRPHAGQLSDVVIQHVRAIGCTLAASVTGLPGYPVRNVEFTDVTLEFAGGGSMIPLRSVPEQARTYPECTMFGPLPASGIYLRHVAGAILHRVTIVPGEGDPRPAVVGDTVSGISAVQLETAKHSGIALMLRRSSNSAALSLRGRLKFAGTNGDVRTDTGSVSSNVVYTITGHGHPPHH